MEIKQTPLKDAFIMHLFHVKDERGEFIKTFDKSTFKRAGLNTNFEESFYSINKKNVIRGMHFQIPPNDHDKIVYCNAGLLIDVIVDLRKDSPTYKKIFKIKLDSTKPKALYIPKGFAHGFESLENNTIMTYLTSTQHDPKSDCGISYLSFINVWETSSPIISKRDLSFPVLSEFDSPF